MAYDFPPLVTDYAIEWDTPGPGRFDGPGEHYEHGWITFDNGYMLSVLRIRKNGDEDVEEFTSEGFEDGLWETGIMREAGPVARLLGMTGEPAPELQDLADEFNGQQHPFLGVVGNLDNAAVNQLAARIAAQPKYEGDDHWQPAFADLAVPVLKEFVEEDETSE